ncbi:nucleotidyltransferase [Pseudorhodoferax sp.]|uniref:nucleotidyltransferase n=1 Tax=Pseudorhodoferax sp. TaxID=1993553 RepID=UPI002DD6621D|nr:nucleotidyltransferase [Pseudorhodoferax sp.]
MPRHATAPALDDDLGPAAADFYRAVLQALVAARIPFLVGGAMAHACHTGVHRPTKDLDLFIRKADCARIAQRLQAQGWRTELPYPHWLAKVHRGPAFIDLIFGTGNGLTPVDAAWFRRNRRITLLGVPVRIVNMEDSLLTKAFIMERERYDGGDIAHLLLAHAERLDWPGLLERFGPHWRVLLAHLSLFGFIYPGERQRIPAWVLAELVERLAREGQAPNAERALVCDGTLLSRAQYLHDVQQLGYRDGRLMGAGSMTAEDVAIWTAAIASEPRA